MDIMPSKYKEIDFDSVETSEEAIRIMKSKKCLYDAYTDRYHEIMNLKKKYLSSGGKILEIGSGGGFIKDIYPEIITSDIKSLSNVDLVIDAETLPFPDNSLDAIISVAVIHHIPDICSFLNEASRALKPNGGIICIEPNWTPVARFVFTKMHPEPYLMNAEKWELDSKNPWSSNQALSYIILKRDKDKFKKLFPQFKLIYRRNFDFLRYTMTGGIWLKQKAPNWMFPFFKTFEFLLKPFMPIIALRHIFILQKII